MTLTPNQRRRSRHRVQWTCVQPATLRAYLLTRIAAQGACDMAKSQNDQPRCLLTKKYDMLAARLRPNRTISSIVIPTGVWAPSLINA